MDSLLLQTHSQDLLIYLYKLYQGRSLCDIDIESSDGVVFHTHRIVFASVSTYLHNLMTSRPDLSTLKLSIHSNVLQVLLEFGYTGQLFISPHLRQDVHGAATLLQMYSVLELIRKYSNQDDLELETAYEEIKTVPDLVPNSQDNRHDDTAFRTGRQDSHHGDTVNTTEITGFTIEYVNDLETPRTGVEEGETILQTKPDHATDKNTRKSTRLKTRKLRNTKLCKIDKDTKSKRVIRSRKSQTKGSNMDKDTFGNEVANSIVDLKLVELSVMCKTEKEKVDRKTEKEKDDPGNTFESDHKFKTLQNKDKSKRAKTKKCDKESNKHCVESYHSDNGQMEPRKMALKCCHCEAILPLHIPSLHHEHMYKSHRESYLTQLYSCFLARKSSQCKLGPKFSYWQTGSKKLLSCNICSKRFRRYSLFFQHFNRDHLCKPRNSWFHFLFKKSKIKLKVCNDSKKDAQKPVSVSKKKTFRCSLCVRRFASEVNLAAHTMKFHVEGIQVKKTRNKQIRSTHAFKCFICGRCLVSQNALCKHLQNVHSQLPDDAKINQYELSDTMKCEVTSCQFSSTNLLDMSHHVTDRHPYIQYGCHLCSGVFKVALMLERHVVSKHSVSKEARFECSTCSRAFPRAQTLKRHEYFKHGINHEGVKVYTCSHEGCGHVTSSSSSLKLHQSKHSKEKRFTCEFCGLKLKTEVSHKKHLNKMHLGVRPYLCQVCGQSFGEDHELKSHFNYKHTTDKEYKCQLCSYATNVKNTYFTHMFNVHKVRDKDDKRQEYQCTLCPFKSILHHRFKVHVNSHTNTREYWCNICNKSFISSSTLHAHKQWMHSETVFSCTQCEYQTKTRQKLNEHIRVQHQLKGFKPYKCPYCEFRCATGGNTRKHIKQVHRGYEVQYIRDTGMLDAARLARATGHHAKLSFPSNSQPEDVGTVCAIDEGIEGSEYNTSLNHSTLMVQ